MRNCRPGYPVLAAAQAAGQVNPDQVNLVERALHRVDIVCPALLAEAEETLVGYARLFAPPELAKVCNRLVDAIDPDGTRPDDALHAEQRFLTLSSCRDGMSKLDGRLTPAAAQLAAVLGPLAKPKPTVETVRDGKERAVPIRAPPSSGCTTPSRTPAHGCSARRDCPTPAAPPPPSSSP